MGRAAVSIRPASWVGYGNRLSAFIANAGIGKAPAAAVAVRGTKCDRIKRRVGAARLSEIHGQTARSLLIGAV